MSCRRCGGKLFHRRGPAALKHRSPKLLCIHGMKHFLMAAECTVCFYGFLTLGFYHCIRIWIVTIQLLAARLTGKVLCLWWLVPRSGNGISHINKVKQCRARSVLVYKFLDNSAKSFPHSTRPPWSLKWRLTNSNLCSRGETQTMFYALWQRWVAICPDLTLWCSPVAGKARKVNLLWKYKK